ncbi:hypothetical protein pb186bvf_003831 [Paramecium bursaria]
MIVLQQLVVMINLQQFGILNESSFFPITNQKFKQQSLLQQNDHTIISKSEHSIT